MKYEIVFDEQEQNRRKEKITNAFAGKKLKAPEDFPMIVSTPNYYAFAGNDRGMEYYESPEEMLKFQVTGYQKHLDLVQDDFVPYFMPWYGTGVLASAFGCEIKNSSGDPGVASTCVRTVSEAAKLKKPDPYRDGYMPVVLNTIEYARKNSNLPVGPTDLNSPLCTLAQICGYDNLFIWMYEEPALVHDLMALVCETFTDWVKLQKEYTGEPMDASNGLQGVWSPKGVGVWVSDDDLVSMSPELYEEFVVPYYSKIFETFGGASLHYCGAGNHQLHNIEKIRGVKVINNGPLGKFEEFADLVKNRPQGVMIQIQDSVPLDQEDYYGALFDAIDSVDGMMIATWITSLALTREGGYVEADWDRIETANNAVKTVREIIGNKFF